ncbi:mitochondrial inner membrane protease subunit 2 isoform X2 [Columba livia]|uniref:mitochondrial inner membrane protease subunit 2 isoform X2 n=1 Tax=Columba livia TaxID=8932 RepID=UPI0031B9BF52
MAQAHGLGKKYLKAFFKGFFVAVPVTVTFLDRVACVARVEGASMQPSLNPGGRQASDVVLLNHWSIRNYDVQRGDIVSLVSPRNPEQKIIKRVIALEGDIIKDVSIVPVSFLMRGEMLHKTAHSLMKEPLDTKRSMLKFHTGIFGWKVITTDTALTAMLLARFLLDFCMLELLISSGLHNAGRDCSQCYLRSANHSRERKSDLYVQMEQH